MIWRICLGGTGLLIPFQLVRGGFEGIDLLDTGRNFDWEGLHTHLHPKVRRNQTYQVQLSRAFVVSDSRRNLPVNGSLSLLDESRQLLIAA